MLFVRIGGHLASWSSSLCRSNGGYTNVEIQEGLLGTRVRDASIAREMLQRTTSRIQLLGQSTSVESNLATRTRRLLV